MDDPSCCVCVTTEETVLEGEVTIPNGRTCQNRWQAPLVNWVKLNIDGSCWSNLNLASAVEVVRDQHGKWVIGYGRNIGSCIAAVTELWTIFDGLQLLWSKGANHVLFESDSKVVVHVCTNEDDIYGNYALTSCIKEIQHRNWTVHVTHIYRESNIEQGLQVHTAPTTVLVTLLGIDSRLTYA
ncbi:hypothetical protein Gohar_020696, partial [Gossypium harknessii]|nr:hypothetical protein [Gossypium harknessii]